MDLSERDAGQGEGRVAEQRAQIYGAATTREQQANAVIAKFLPEWREGCPILTHGPPSEPRTVPVGRADHDVGLTARACSGVYSGAMSTPDQADQSARPRQAGQSGGASSPARSEERRVGKEGRSGWAASRKEKNRDEMSMIDSLRGV